MIQLYSYPEASSSKMIIIWFWSYLEFNYDPILSLFMVKNMFQLLFWRWILIMNIFPVWSYLEDEYDYTLILSRGASLCPRPQSVSIHQKLLCREDQLRIQNHLEITICGIKPCVVRNFVSLHISSVSGSCESVFVDAFNGIVCIARLRRRGWGQIGDL